MSKRICDIINKASNLSKGWMLFVLIILAFNNNAQIGALDNTFGNGGLLTFTLHPQSNFVRGMLIKSDNKILLLGHYPDPSNVYNIDFLSLLNSDGSFSTWGNNGVITATDVAASDLAIQSDQGILIAGGNSEFRVKRFLQDGTVDSGFGANGTVTTNITLWDDHARKVLVQPDGKILLAGDSDSGIYVLARYNYNGALDNSFGQNGIATVSVGNPTALTCYAAGLQPDGKVLLLGRNGNKTHILRFQTNGQLDNTFGVNGISTTTLIGGTTMILGSGKLYIGGSTTPSPNHAFIRLNSDGTLDSSFGTNSLSVITSSLRAQSITLQPDGKIIACGYTATPGVGSEMVARYNSSGNLDSSFGSNGSTITDINSGNDMGEYVQMTTDGKILVTGESIDNVTSITYLFLARYNSGLQIGIKENANYMSDIIAYPNPFNDKLKVTIANGFDPSSLEIFIFNNTGSLVHKHKTKEFEEEINLSSLPKGIYYLRMIHGSQINSIKISKE